MTLAMELRQQRREGEAQGVKKRDKEVILNMASMQMPVEVITQALHCTPEFVKSVLSQNA